MEYYVVRVYRREGEEIIGIIDDPMGERRTSFRNRDELWSALCEQINKVGERQSGR